VEMSGYTYCMSDIHNDYDSFVEMLDKISFSPQDKMYIVGDVFDRGMKPAELYREIRRHDNITVLRGNHDQWVMEYIYDYYGKGVKNSYYYNTFEFLQEQSSEEEMMEIADWIATLPFYEIVTVDGKRYQLAHARTDAEPEKVTDNSSFLMGYDIDYIHFLREGLADTDYISVCGHIPTANIRAIMCERQVVPHRVWSNYKENVFIIDCGNGYRGEVGRALGCLRLDDNLCFYV